MHRNLLKSERRNVKPRARFPEVQFLVPENVTLPGIQPGRALNPMAFGSGKRTRIACMIARGTSVFVLVLLLVLVIVIVIVIVIAQGSLLHFTDGVGWCLPRNKGY